MSEIKVSEKASKLVFDVSAKSMQRAAYVAGIGEINRMNEAIQTLFDYIADLESGLASTKAGLAGYEWILLSSGNLPKIGERVFVAMENGWVAIGCWGSPLGVPERVWKNDSGQEIHNVTYWMPKPEAPKGEVDRDSDDIDDYTLGSILDTNGTD